MYIGDQILTASVHDVRYIVALLRGINFSNVRPSSKIHVNLVKHIAEARIGHPFGRWRCNCHRGRGTILARYEPFHQASSVTLLFSTATSYIYPDHFDEWNYVAEIPPATSQLSDPQLNSTATSFEIPLNTLLECLNVYGTGNMALTGNASIHKKWRREDNCSDDELHEERQGGRQRAKKLAAGPANNRIDQYFGGGSDKRTRMRLSYVGPGHPLTLWL